jgi:hypothetical protein
VLEVIFGDSLLDELVATELEETCCEERDASNDDDELGNITTDELDASNDDDELDNETTEELDASNDDDELAPPAGSLSTQATSRVSGSGREKSEHEVKTRLLQTSSKAMKY